MATTNRPLADEIRQHNTALDSILRARFGMSFRTFKIIKAITQLVGVAAGVYAMALGADPMTAMALITLIYAGPEAAEVVLTHGQQPPPTETSRDSE